ncbi:Tn3 family transposase [Streptomyces sp. NPDC048424]|uniref:Tn3 family transposase n=1 Tax=Streptomyces sp. NPDC048424 TaxID=3155265 RepID=UPI00343D9D83
MRVSHDSGCASAQASAPSLTPRCSSRATTAPASSCGQRGRRDLEGARLPDRRRGPRLRPHPHAVAGRAADRLGDAFAHYGRIFKTLDLLQFVSDTGYRRMIGKHLNITEARHPLARKIFFGQRGELRQHYRGGMEDQLGALELAF